jgi:hypothetical protein
MRRSGRSRSATAASPVVSCWSGWRRRSWPGRTSWSGWTASALTSRRGDRPDRGARRRRLHKLRCTRQDWLRLPDRWPQRETREPHLARRRTACGRRSVPRCRQATARRRQAKLVGEALAGGTEITDEERAEVPPSAMKDLVEALDQIRRLARSYFLFRAVTVATRSSSSSRDQRGGAGEPGGAGDDDPQACLLW